MKIDEYLVEKIEYIEILKEGSYERKTGDFLQEHSISVYINGKYAFDINNCLNQYLIELVFGHMKTEGLINDISMIEDIHILDDGKKAEISITNQITENQNVENTLLSISTRTELKKSISYQDEWIFHLADEFAKGTVLHATTKAAHSCFLAKEDQILFSCEDIGRHNAVDKAVGYALKNKIDLADCILLSSGRMPTDMVTKAINAGIPILCSKASPTIEAIKLAKKYNITLITNVRPDSMRKYG